MSKRWQNLTNQPLDALNEPILLSAIANSLICFSSVSSPYLILVWMTLSMSSSVGRPPPSLRSHPNFFHLKRLRLGIPYRFDTMFTSSPFWIYNKSQKYAFHCLLFLLASVFPVGSSDTLLLRLTARILLNRRGRMPKVEQLKRRVRQSTSFLVLQEQGTLNCWAPVALRCGNRLGTLTDCLHVFQTNLIFGRWLTYLPYQLLILTAKTKLKFAFKTHCPL